MRGLDEFRGRKSVITAQVLALGAAFPGLLFLRDGTAGTLFLFSTLTPLLEVIAVVILAVCLWRRHHPRAIRISEQGAHTVSGRLEGRLILGLKGNSRKGSGARSLSASIILFTALGLCPAPARGSDAEADRAVFEAKCEKCHGEDGKGNPAMARLLKLKQPFIPLGIQEVQKKSNEELKKIAINGVRTTRSEMKPVKGGISEAQAEAVVRYVRTFKP
jgi:mono/diheme cytochrome c family protein